ncbi:MAG TPA: class I SAM-dependent methyltransferase [Gemmatimonadales bacterium]|nr:class I SAM-dependent methyltransferase [Gemmatimonadales bacterium]
MTQPGAKAYDRRYFDRWYRNPRSRVRAQGELERTAALVVAAAEQVLGRRVASVLDIGCGEGRWQPALRKLRPRVKYIGIDPSEYAVGRFGPRRNIRLGGIEDLPSLGLPGPYDVIVCADVLHYLPDAQLAAGLAEIADRLGGMAYLEAYTSSDRLTGDLNGLRRRSPVRYRRAFRAAGLVPCGLHCYVTSEIAESLGALEFCAG